MGHNVLTGVRGRVILAVLAITVILFSAFGTVGYLQIQSRGRAQLVGRVNVVLDQLEHDLRVGVRVYSITTSDGVFAHVASARAGAPATDLTSVEISRLVSVGSHRYLLIGYVSQARLLASLAALHRVVWVAVPLAAIIAAALASDATRRAPRPVQRMTLLVSTIGPGDEVTRLDVPATNDEIEELARSMNRMLDRIAAGRFAQRQFTSDAAHELRTPLMALLGEIELARKQGIRQNDHVLGVLEGQVTRLGERVSDLVLLSILDEVPRAYRPTSLLDLVSIEALSFTSRIDVVGINPAVAEVDGPLVARAVRNLLSNAVRHSTSRVAVTVHVAEA